MPHNTSPTGIERYFDANDIIVSKTNLKGHITYINKIFMDISDYTEMEIIGKPHSLIRHPDMPRTIFKTLWDYIQNGQEVFAYVINCAKNGDHYWVYAHVTPSLNVDGRVIGYHSNRRVPDRKVLENYLFPLYDELRAVEQKEVNKKNGLCAGSELLQNILNEANIAYDEFIVTIGQGKKNVNQ